MAGGSRTAQSNADGIPTLGNRSKSGASAFNDDVVSNQRGRSGYQQDVVVGRSSSPFGEARYQDNLEPLAFGRPPTGAINRPSNQLSQGFADASSVARMQRDNSVDHSQGGNIKPLFKEDPLKQLTNFGASDFTPKSNAGYGGYGGVPTLFKGISDDRPAETFA